MKQYHYQVHRVQRNLWQVVLFNGKNEKVRVVCLVHNPSLAETVTRELNQAFTLGTDLGSSL